MAYTIHYLAILDRGRLLVFKNTSKWWQEESVYFVICPKQAPKMEGVAQNRVGLLGLFMS